MTLFLLAVGVSLVAVLAKSLWLAFMRRNNPTYPDHKHLDDTALAYEHAQGRLLNIPLKRTTFASR